MLIHELNDFTGTPGATDYLAIDTGTDTCRIPAFDLGITDEMTQAQAEAGTSTDPKVITPKVFKDAVEAIAPIPDEIVYYATSSTAAGTAAKIAACADFALFTGAHVEVAFTYGNTYSGQITLNVNSTGAKQVRDYGQFYDGYSQCAWDAGQVMIFVYDGTYWRLCNGAIITSSELDALETALGI